MHNAGPLNKSIAPNKAEQRNWSYFSLKRSIIHLHRKKKYIEHGWLWRTYLKLLSHFIVLPFPFFLLFFLPLQTLLLPFLLLLIFCSVGTLPVFTNNNKNKKKTVTTGKRQKNSLWLLSNKKKRNTFWQTDWKRGDVWNTWGRGYALGEHILLLHCSCILIVEVMG